MSPDPPALDSSLAPAQIYIVFAITVASFSWLLKPETLGELTGRQVLVGGLLIFYQLLHVATYATIQVVRPEINFVMHVVALASYTSATAWLFRARWIEAKSRPPSDPDDD